MFRLSNTMRQDSVLKMVPKNGSKKRLNEVSQGVRKNEVHGSTFLLNRGSEKYTGWFQKCYHGLAKKCYHGLAKKCYHGPLFSVPLVTLRWDAFCNIFSDPFSEHCLGKRLFAMKIRTRCELLANIILATSFANWYRTHRPPSGYPHYGFLTVCHLLVPIKVCLPFATKSSQVPFCITFCRKLN